MRIKRSRPSATGIASECETRQLFYGKDDRAMRPIQTGLEKISYGIIGKGE